MEEYITNQELSLELVKSIKGIDIRISELNNLAAECQKIGTPIVLIIRIKDLMKTRSKLVRSLKKINSNQSMDPESLNPFDRLDIEI